jgi:hypothetical protein
MATNQAFHAATSSAGYYTFPILQPAVYKITVHAAGFKEYVRNSVQLDVAATLEIDASMDVGQVAETVTVTAELPLLESQTSSLGQVIANKTVNDLPLNGRNAYGFAALVPGVVAPYGFTQTAFDEYNDQFISINGSRPNQNLFLLDGGVNSEPAFTGPGYFPSVDLVQEYKVQTNNLSAEYSNTGGGIINVITKSGSNRIRGSAWEFFRNTSLVANDYFSNHAGLPRAEFKFNQFGVTLGGPIIHDKTFFFFAYEGLRWVQSGSAVGTLPTAAQRTGDFSSTYDSNGKLIKIYDPRSTVPDPSHPGQYIRTQYPGNKIPASSIDPVAANLLEYLPLPNQPGTVTGANNYFTNYSSPITENSFSLRLDHAITSKQSILARYSINDTSQTRPNLYGKSSPNFLISNPTAGNDFLRQQQITVDYTNAFSPNAILNLNSSYVRYYIGRTLPGYGVNPTTAGLPSYFTALASSYSPCFPTVGIAGLGLSLSLGNIGGGLIGSGCYKLGDTYPDLRENGSVTIVHGQHTLKAGADYGIAWLSTPRNEPAGPSFNFDAGFTKGPNPITSTDTGVGLASFLAGTGSGGSSTSGGPNQYLSSKYWGVFIQDDWRITPRLTLNLGVRYDYSAPWVERYNRFTGFDPTIVSPLQVSGLAQLKGGLIFPGVNNVPRSEFDPYRREFVPRLGFAYAPTSTITLRGGYGIFYAPLGGAGFNGQSVPNTGFLSTTAWVTTLDGVTPLNTLSDPFPQGFILPSGSSQGASTFLGQSVVGMIRNRPVSYAQQWNVDVQTALPGKMLLDIAYAGGHGVHLYGDYNPNSLPDSALALGPALNTKVANPFFGAITNGGLSGPTVAASQLLRPFPQFTGVNYGNSSFYGASAYNSLQAKLVRRFGNGFSFLTSYTWSRLMDNIGASETGFPGGSYGGSGIQNWNNLRGEWAVASFDTPQYLAFNGIYELPFGKGKRFLNHSSVANYLIGGWQLNGISTMISGTPLQVTPATNTLFNYGGTQRANWNGHNPSRGGKVSSRLNQYFTVSDFSTPAPFTYGNSPRSLANLRSPGRINTDLSAIKKVPISERFTGELRAEAFNLFNHPTFGNPNTRLGSGNTGVITSQVNLPRQIQLAVKVTW